jgi:hypothetical protein
MRYLVSRVVRSYGAGVSTAAVIEAMVLRIRAAMWIAVRVGGGGDVRSWRSMLRITGSCRWQGGNSRGWTCWLDEMSVAVASIGLDRQTAWVGCVFVVISIDSISISCRTSDSDPIMLIR